MSLVICRHLLFGKGEVGDHILKFELNCDFHFFSFSSATLQFVKNRISSVYSNQISRLEVNLIPVILFLLRRFLKLLRFMRVKIPAIGSDSLPVELPVYCYYYYYLHSSRPLLHPLLFLQFVIGCTKENGSINPLLKTSCGLTKQSFSENLDPWLLHRSCTTDESCAVSRDATSF